MGNIYWFGNHWYLLSMLSLSLSAPLILFTTILCWKLKKDEVARYWPLKLFRCLNWVLNIVFGPGRGGASNEYKNKGWMMITDPNMKHIDCESWWKIQNVKVGEFKSLSYWDLIESRKIIKAWQPWHYKHTFKESTIVLYDCPR